MQCCFLFGTFQSWRNNFLVATVKISQSSFITGYAFFFSPLTFTLVAGFQNLQWTHISYFEIAAHQNSPCVCLRVVEERRNKKRQKERKVEKRYPRNGKKEYKTRYLFRLANKKNQTKLSNMNFRLKKVKPIKDQKKHFIW